MKKYFVVIFLMLVGILGGNLSGRHISAEDQAKDDVIISEFSPGSQDSASQEFVELFNTTDSSYALKNCKLQYASSSGITWSTKIAWDTDDDHVIPPHDYFLLASTDYLTDTADGSFTAGMSAIGGHVRLLDSNGDVQDLLGWGTAATPLGHAAEAPPAGQSLARPLDDDTMHITNDNAADFSLTTHFTPKADNIIEGIINPPPTEDPGNYPALEISELLPNPASPQTDADDEFVELYNPNSQAVDLTGYTIITGNSDSYKYQINGVSLPPGAYKAFFSRDTKLVLSNTGSRAKLLAPDDSQVDITDSYTAAPDGQAWMYASDSWQWTTTPSPGQANIFNAPAAVKSATTAASKKKTSTAKAKSSKSRKSGTVLGRSKSKNGTTGSSGPTLATTNRVHAPVLAAIGGLALLYAGYEYRNDLANTLHRFRRHRASRGASGEGVAATGLGRIGLRLGRWQNHVRAWLGSRTWL